MRYVFNCPEYSPKCLLLSGPGLSRVLWSFPGLLFSKMLVSFHVQLRQSRSVPLLSWVTTPIPPSVLRVSCSVAVDFDKSFVWILPFHILCCAKRLLLSFVFLVPHSHVSFAIPILKLSLGWVSNPWTFPCIDLSRFPIWLPLSGFFSWSKSPPRFLIRSVTSLIHSTHSGSSPWFHLTLIPPNQTTFVQLHCIRAWSIVSAFSQKLHLGSVGIPLWCNSSATGRVLVQQFQRIFF